MNNNTIGLFVSFIFFCLIYIVSSCLFRLKILVGERCRKFIHISAGYWWIIAMVYFDNFIYASIIPLIFIILNAISHKYNLVKIIERKNNKNLGTIYYPISLLVLVILTFGILNKPYVGGIGTLCMAYGDGFAAIIGTEIKSRKIYHNKTIVGTLTMLIISAFFTMIILLKYNTERIVISVIIVSIVATTLELFSKKGLDNLTVPILSSLTYLLIMYL